MNLDERIANVKPYFLLFNVNADEDATFVVAKFPENWSIPNAKGLFETYKVQVGPMENGVCFATEIKNGIDCVFDALEYVIEFNKRMEERRALINEKLEELKKLFSTEPLDRLKTLTFVFDEPKKKRGKTIKKTESQQEDTAESVPEQEVEKSEENKEPTEQNNDSEFMEFAKNIAGE